MASNKECLIIVLDVRTNAGQEFKQKSIKCAAEILKDKICAARKDYVSFVLLGCKRTSNEPNDNISADSYLNVVQYSEVQLATWQLFINFFRFIQEETCDQGEWLDGLVVAMDMLKTSQDLFKFHRQRILLFYDFNDGENDYDMFDVITENILKVDIGLIVVSPNIMYIDNPDDDDRPQSIFASLPAKTDQQAINEKYALRLVSSCNAQLCNFERALQNIFQVSNSRPWMWNAKLCIGSRLHINVSGFLVVRDESNIKLKKCWAEDNETVSRGMRYYIKGVEVQPEQDDLIDAYMLGATPIPYDEPLTEGVDASGACLKFLGFTQRDSIPQEYFSGKTLYWLVHKRDQTASAQKMDALVRALLKANMVMLCWKIYSAKLNRPKLVVLLPNELQEDKPATLSMIELSYHTQHHFWDFPSLRTEKTECTAQQLAAIDNLIDAMDLKLGPKEAKEPRNTYEKDLLPFDTLPHIYEQNMMDVLERKVLRIASDDDDLFLDMLTDKNFYEVYWTVPELREQQAKNAAKQVKELFPLEPNEKALQKAKARAIYEGKLPTQDLKVEIKPITASMAEISLERPAEDFKRLLREHVEPLQDNLTLRQKQYDICASQMRNAIWTLIFENGSEKRNEEEIANALRVYRESCFRFNGMSEYDEWMMEMRDMIVPLRMHDFWQRVVVKPELGLCIVGKASTDELDTLRHFYDLTEDLSVDEILKQYN